ncbi:IS1182 family transposase [Aquimarina sp. TRL1]|uniref:IS1182 family transposase n=1 Tax=Aquimarina sp. (strain TRL1) TaxID=2736252 RepID=UPI00158D0303|nr:IS1182 family transposase [Aquimarina sp. TRL1]QKX04118.1 IS1182 family transposase [Aquimarina sp. TRL1]
MQGKKIYQEKLFSSFQLSARVPKTNFYRRLHEVLHLDFLYQATKKYYGKSGQQSIDPVVFFKFCLVGYLENIISDRKLIEHCSMRMDLLYFLGYDIDEELPWHSTISRTRQLFPEEVFTKVFEHILELCIGKGMVCRHTQAVDSAPVKSNASMDSLELKVPIQDLKAHLAEVRHISNRDKEIYRKAKQDKASKAQKTITANKKQLDNIVTRNKKWSKDQNYRVGSNNKGSRYTSNKTHYSPTDPDARISVKPGKARKLNYLSQLVVDSGHHVITDIQAYHADGKDNQQLQDIVLRTKERLWNYGFLWENCLADTGYSSGENYAFLEQQQLESYIPAHGTYKGGPEGFTYHKEQDYYECPQGKVIPFKKVFVETKNQTKKKEYRASKQVCKECPIRTQCLKSSQEKRITVTFYREEYERNNARVKSKRGRQMKAIRQSTVEPVFGTLTQFMGLRKINTIGLSQANKVMHLSATAYNLKKYLKFIEKRVKNEAKAKYFFFLIKNVLIDLKLSFIRP